MNCEALSFVLWGILFRTVVAQTTPCNQGNRSLCLQGVKAILGSSNWWFGDTYRSECPEELRGKDFRCWNPDPDKTTVGERIFQRHNYPVDSISQVLRIRYNVEGGVYSACGRRFQVEPLHMSEDVDSTHVVGYDSWTLRHRPAIIWEPTDGKFYTLLAYNVGELQLAGLWVNINGGESSQGYELHHYLGLKNPFDRVTLQAFVVFQQSETIAEDRFTLIQEEIERFTVQNNQMYSLDNLLAIMPQIQEPMALGYIAVRSDPFAIQYHKDMRNVNNCPRLIDKSWPEIEHFLSSLNLKDLNITTDLTKLELEVQVEFRSEAIDYTACCVNIHEEARIVPVNPLSRDPIAPLYLRRQPWIRLDNINMADLEIFFLGSFFSLFMLDVTDSLDLTIRVNPTLLWHVSNIRKPYPSDSGYVNTEYVMPFPNVNRNASSVYVILVFRQTSGPMGNVSWDRYCQRNHSIDCKLDLHLLVSENHFSLSGVSLFASQPDLYSRMLMYESNITTKSEACSVEPTYVEPCPVPELCPTTVSPLTAPTVTTAGVEPQTTEAAPPTDNTTAPQATEGQSSVETLSTIAATVSTPSTTPYYTGYNNAVTATPAKVFNIYITTIPLLMHVSIIISKIL